MTPEQYKELCSNLDLLGSREYGRVWTADQCKLAAAAIRELMFIIDVDKESAALSQSAAYDSGAGSVWARLAEGFDVLDEDGEAVAFRARYCFEAGDRSVGIQDADWFEIIAKPLTSDEGTSAGRADQKGSE